MDIKVVIDEKNIKVSYKERGKVVSKNVAPEDFIAAIQEDMVLRTGIISRGVREYLVSGPTTVITLETPPRTRKIVYQKRNINVEHKYNIPFPGLVFIFKIVSNKLNNAWVYATKEPLLRKSVELFLFPYGNVYGDGRICWGDESFLAADTYTATNVSSIVTRFIQAPFNDDLDDNLFKANKEIKTSQQLMQLLDNTIVFPDKVLKAVSSYESKINSLFSDI